VLPITSVVSSFTFSVKVVSTPSVVCIGSTTVDGSARPSTSTVVNLPSRDFSVSTSKSFFTVLLTTTCLSVISVISDTSGASVLLLPPPLTLNL